MLPRMAQDLLSFEYRFTLPGGKVQRFQVDLDRASGALVPKKRGDYPEWTRLSSRQCPNCPLKEKDSPRCPIAANLTEVIEAFKTFRSFEETEVEIVSEARNYRKKVPLSQAISSLIGIYMVTSGCPVMDKLKPMARTHLPFATWQETLYRTISMYLTAQFFRSRKGLEPDWELKRLMETYDGIRLVNKSFSERLHQASVTDASLNALVHLDCFAGIAMEKLQSDDLDALERYFSAYLA